MTVLLALGAALSYGLSDFVGGIASRRVSPWAVALMALVGGALAVGLVGLVHGGEPTASDAGWAVLAGLGNGFGTAFLYRGLAGGRMGVVAPLSAVGAAVVPLLVGLLTGERPGAFAWLGILSALPAIWLVAREPVTPTTAVDGAGGRAAGVVDGLLAGLGFGVLFAALGQIPEESGLLPLALNQVVGGVVIAGLATLVRAPWRPRERWAVVGMLSGLLGATATTLFLAATQQGLLTVASVLTSLYPAFTVLLAAVFLRERIHAWQGAGLALAAAAVTLIALG